ncbi:hypothetical protein [Nocardioides ferulae]|uniref:hypothetical protein n=1 Tax=Nocardioides ferulae TaxID=2340821 RepID=UPI000EB0E963|nr:hypothetical protein [Nocardioides ferulae]
MYDPTSARLATDLARSAVLSARPDAPVVADDHRPVLARSRVGVAATLHAIARRVEPAERSTTARPTSLTTGGCVPG